MTATFLLIRHAEHVEYDRCLSGRRAGVALSERGQAQAAALGQRLAGTGLSRVECSPLERTRATATAIAAAAGLPAPTAVEALIEINMGEWSGRALDGFGDDPAWRAWNIARATARIPGGESMSEAQARIVGHLRGIATAKAVAKAGADRIIAVVTHADMIRAVVAEVLGLSLDNLLRFDIEPASVTTVVMGDWGVKLLSLNVPLDLGVS